MKIITNNPSFIEYRNFEIDYYDVGYLDILFLVRDLIHKNYKIVTHPLYGNITPTTTIFRTVVVEEGNYLDLESVYIIEDSIEKVKRIIETDNQRNLTESIRKDLEFIDFALISETLNQIL